MKLKKTHGAKIKRRNFISFAFLALTLCRTGAAWRWLYKSPEETPGITAGAHKPLRKRLNKTELFFRRLPLTRTTW
jgi:hypothetical protein